MTRTTIRLDEHLFRDVKQLAAQTHQTITSLIEESLREKLRSARKTPSAKLPSLPVFHGTGVQPGVDIDDSASLLELMEAGLPVEKRR